jgi:uncharacterized membrane protein
MAQKNVLFVGETWTVTKFHTKGFDVIPLGGFEDFSVYLKKGLAPFQDINITHIPNHLVLSAYPQTIEQISKFDVVIISDCGRNTLAMYPDMFKVPMGPNKVKLTADYVRKGGSLIMVGGYVDFQGFQGKGNYHGSEIEGVLPVNIMETDDRIECTEGVKPKVIKGDHKILKDISNDWPKFLGYQRVFPKADSEVLATIGEKEDAFIIVGKAGKGKSMAFTSDLAPHWGTDFVAWKDYGKFWYKAINWLAE